MQLAVIAFGNQGHGIGMERQVFLDQAHVAGPDKRHRQATIQKECVGFTQGLDARADLRRINRVRPLAHQPHDHRIVAAVTDTCGRQRTEKLNLNAPHLFQLMPVAQRLNKQCRRAHWPDGVGTGRADAHLE